jgi:hypothetical protein
MPTREPGSGSESDKEVPMKLVVLIVALASLSAGCQAGQSNSYTCDVALKKIQAEVAPGKTVEIKEFAFLWELKKGSWNDVHAEKVPRKLFYQVDTTYLSIPRAKHELLWVGVGVPFLLREWKSALYLVVLDRETSSTRMRFRFYKEDMDCLREIRVTEFPKEIAVQNLWLTTKERLQATAQLDAQKVVFQSSLTAKLWCQLETGKEFYEQAAIHSEAFLRGFMKKHKLERLTYKNYLKQPSSKKPDTGSLKKRTKEDESPLPVRGKPKRTERGPAGAAKGKPACPTKAPKAKDQDGDDEKS